jgi:predicted extracellular nuclease
VSRTPSRRSVRSAALAVGGLLVTVAGLGTYAGAAPGARAAGSTTVHIRDIQGRAHISPYNGRSVKSVPGVVTAVGPSGYWLQDPQPDTDVATSEGIYCYVGSAPTVKVGDSVTVSGTVSEYRPGGSSSGNLTTTEITYPRASVLAHGVALPAPTVVGSGGRVPPGSVVEDDATGDVETSGVFDPAADGLDFWESMEGMRVEIDGAQVVGPTNAYNEIPVVPQGSTVRTARGGILTRSTDLNPERVVVDDVLAPVPTVNVGDAFTGASVGVLDYDFGTFRLHVTSTPAVTSGGIAKEVTAAPASGQLAVATFNVENLDPTDPQAKFDRLASTIVSNLRSPDLLALEEVQDNDGPTDDGVVAADRTLTMLTQAITAAGGPSYTWREIDPVNDADGGEPGGNIRVVFLFRTDRGLAFVDRPGGTSTTATSVTTVNGQAALTYSPGRVDPANSAWNSSRKPLAGEFTWQGATFFAVANHFNSKGGDDPVMGHLQPPTASTETQRHAQASAVRSFVDQIQAVDPTARVLVLGDLNDYEFSQTAGILVGSGTGALTDLPRTLPDSDRYTYDYEGNSQVLDHILLSGSLAGAYDYDVVHVNAEFADQVSDHDPQVVRLTF